MPAQFERACALSALGIRLYERWEKGVRKAGMSTSWAGFDLREITDEGASFIGNYLTKSTYDVAAKLGAEVAASMNTKDTRTVSNLTPFGLLDTIVKSEQSFWWDRPKVHETWWEGAVLNVANLTDGEIREYPTPRLWRTWLEFESVSAGRRQILWSHQKKKCVTELDKFWTECLDARGRVRIDQDIVDVGYDGDLVGEISMNTWVTLSPEVAVGLLEATEAGELAKFCDEHAIAFIPTGEVNPPI